MSDLSSSFPPAPKETSISFSSADLPPIQLEGRLFRGEQPWTAILCHPHPLHGGTLQNKVVDAAMRALAVRGCSTLRFNFRGVGRSDGVYGDGIAEVQDLSGAIEYMAAQNPSDRLLLVGFSFGTGVISRYMDGGGVADGVVLLAPPLGMSPLPTFAVPSCGLHLIVGEHDDFCDVEQFEAHAKKFGPTVRTAIVPEADHFFHGHLKEIVSFVQGVLD